MNNIDKRKLYEGIMKNVATEVKKALNIGNTTKDRVEFTKNQVEPAVVKAIADKFPTSTVTLACQYMDQAQKVDIIVVNEDLNVVTINVKFRTVNNEKYYAVNQKDLNGMSNYFIFVGNAIADASDLKGSELYMVSKDFVRSHIKAYHKNGKEFLLLTVDDVKNNSLYQDLQIN